MLLRNCRASQKAETFSDSGPCGLGKFGPSFLMASGLQISKKVN